MRPPLATENYQDTDPIFPISQKYDSQNTNVRNQANGTNPVAAEESRTSRCQCCPYGFHIDLDFVKFAEDVATGKEHIQVKFLIWYKLKTSRKMRETLGLILEPFRHNPKFQLPKSLK